MLMSLRWMYVVYVHGGVVTLSEYPWRGNEIGLKIISVPKKGRGLFKFFNYPRSVYYWSPCFMLHNCVEIV